MSSTSKAASDDRRTDYDLKLEGSKPFKGDVKVTGPDVNLGQRAPMTAPIYENGGPQK